MTFVNRISVFAVVVAAAWAGGCASAPKPIQSPEPTYEQKLAAILRLEDQRLLRAPAVAPPPVPAGRAGSVVAAAPPPPDLLQWLHDPEARVRRRVALAVGRVGLAEGAAPLAALLRDPEAEVRQMAAFALGLLQDRSAVGALTLALADPSPLAQGRAAEGLGLIGDASSATAIADMVRRHIGQPAVVALARGGEAAEPANPEVEAVRLGLFALARLGAVEPLVTAVLTPDGQPRLHWWPLAYALQRVRDARVAPALLTLARVDDRVSRGFAIVGLGALREPRAVPLLLPVADGWQKDAGLAALAVRALGQIGDQRAVTPLATLLGTRSLDSSVQLETVDALGALGARQATERLYDLLSDEWPTLRAAALKALHRIDAGNFLLVLSGLDPDRHWSVRAATAEILGNYAAEVAVPRLTAALKDGDLRVLPAVLAALGRVKAPGVERILLGYLTHDDAVVRMAASRELGALKPAGGVASLAEAYRFGRRDVTYVARAAALDAAAAYGAPAAVPLLTEALADPEWAVRIRAARLLARLDSVQRRGGAHPPGDARPSARSLRGRLAGGAPGVAARVHRNGAGHDRDRVAGPRGAAHLRIVRHLRRCRVLRRAGGASRGRRIRGADGRPARRR